MNNIPTSTSKIATTEFTLRKILNDKQPGQLLAGPFTNEQEAHSQREQYQGAGVFQETWLS
ncbi:hypothetical protein [Arsukibacterium perlucidum]|uniref:hypothetical protein n=1 Tax=Arsukibacterium perlucidum TaxID=368811 RepID=UPI00036447EE|nr:hypothetical protein [Arsukibacterium perlucidum]